MTTITKNFVDQCPSDDGEGGGTTVAKAIQAVRVRFKVRESYSIIREVRFASFITINSATVNEPEIHIINSLGLEKAYDNDYSSYSMFYLASGDASVGRYIEVEFAISNPNDIAIPSFIIEKQLPHKTLYFKFPL